ncbi:hypothetical protein RCL1_000047 [Eukaryota sp. TZLM3-RCL]
MPIPQNSVHLIPLKGAERSCCLSSEKMNVFVQQANYVDAAHAPLCCVDGRNECCQAASFGGELGEVCLAIEGLSSLSNSVIDVKSLLVEYLKSGHQLYYHSDDHCEESLKLSLAALGHSDVFNICCPPQDLRPVLLDLLLQEKHIGCGHIRLLLFDDRYGATKSLIKQVVVAFWELLWSKQCGENVCCFEDLHGEHEEQAVLIIDSIDDEHVPAVCFKNSIGSSFVFHKDVAQHRREFFAEFLSDKYNVDRANLLEEINNIAQKWQALTLENLASGLPIYEVSID